MPEDDWARTGDPALELVYFDEQTCVGYRDTHNMGEWQTLYRCKGRDCLCSWILSMVRRRGAAHLRRLHPSHCAWQSHCHNQAASRRLRPNYALEFPCSYDHAQDWTSPCSRLYSCCEVTWRDSFHCQRACRAIKESRHPPRSSQLRYGSEEYC